MFAINSIGFIIHYKLKRLTTKKVIFFGGDYEKISFGCFIGCSSIESRITYGTGWWFASKHNTCLDCERLKRNPDTDMRPLRVANVFKNCENKFFTTKNGILIRTDKTKAKYLTVNCLSSKLEPLNFVYGKGKKNCEDIVRHLKLYKIKNKK